MHLLPGIVLFIVIGASLYFAVMCAYFASNAFSATGGLRPLRGSRHPDYWYRRAHGWHLLSAVGMLVIVLDVCAILWGAPWSHDVHLWMFLIGAGSWVVASSVGSDLDRKARRLRG